MASSNKTKRQKRYAPLIIGIGFLIGAFGRFNELMKTGISSDSPDLSIVVIMFAIGIGGLILWYRQ